MDWIKEIVDASNSKIKSPILGSIILAFVGSNWKALFYLAFANADVSNKFEYFDENTWWYTLFAIPIIVGLLLSFFNPRIQLIALKLTQKPVQEAKILQLTLANDRLAKKQELEETRRSAIAAVEEDLIAAAKRDQEIKLIADDEVRKKLEASVEETRNEQPEIAHLSEDSIYGLKLGRLQELISYYDKRRSQAYSEGDMSRGNELEVKIGELEEQIYSLSNREFNLTKPELKRLSSE